MKSTGVLFFIAMPQENYWVTTAVRLVASEQRLRFRLVFWGHLEKAVQLINRSVF